ncbi:hypothetical protein D9M71_773960 [compost metagenome]
MTACTTQIGLHVFHISGDKYPGAAALAIRSLPLTQPAVVDRFDPAKIQDVLDSLRFTGSISNREPLHDSGSLGTVGPVHDSIRIHTTLPLIRAAVAAGISVPGILRGHERRKRATQRDADASKSALEKGITS